jgi:CRP/FNR family transcriptional regulator, cyclic AMP receptor protein
MPTRPSRESHVGSNPWIFLCKITIEFEGMVQKFRAISFEQLTEVSVLRDLQAADIIALQPHTRIHFYQKGDIVMTEGDLLSPQLHTLLQGTLRLTRIGTSGKETLLRTLLPNEIFAAPALFGDAIAPATVTATIESQVLTIVGVAYRR